jgi:hypothetical protein
LMQPQGLGLGYRDCSVFPLLKDAIGINRLVDVVHCETDASIS